MKAYMAQRRVNRREQLLALSDNVCADCGAVENLEFNHIDRATKKFNLSGCHLDKSWKLILEEWNKCELLCSNCHLIYTNGQWARKELVPHNSLRHVPFVHGTARCYNEMPCRCVSCRLAKKSYRNKEIDYHSPIAQWQ
jgi:hypothetical protein